MDDKNDANSDLRYLKLLSIFHYVVGGMLYLFGLFPIFHFIMGLMFLFAPMKSDKPQGAESVFIGFIFILFPLVFITAAWMLATMILISGRRLAQKKSYMFCLVIAGVECIFMPFGTVLGVFTIVLLTRPGVKELFNQTAKTTITESGNS